MTFVRSLDGRYVNLASVDHVTEIDFEDEVLLAVTACGRFKIAKTLWYRIMRQLEAAGEVVA